MTGWRSLQAATRPTDVAELAAGLDRDREAVTAALETPAGARARGGLGREWRAPGRGLFLQLPDGDPEAARAARQLSGVMLLAISHLPRQWVEEVEPQLDDAWAGAAGLFNAGVALTSDELEPGAGGSRGAPAALPQPQ